MSRRRILIIDDDEPFCRTLKRALDRRGCESHYALTAEQALTQAETLAPDFAVLDLRIGEDSGLHLIEPLLARRPTLRITILTGYASLATAVQAIKLGATNYLAKPVDASAVLRALSDPDNCADLDLSRPQPTPLRQLEWEHLQRVLAENNGNISAAARELGMHRRTLQRKLQKRPGTPRNNN